MISLAEATQQLLEERAATAEVGSTPQPYQVLYDFYCMRSNYKAAAVAQYKLAMRTRGEGQHLPHFLGAIAAALCKCLPLWPTSNHAAAEARHAPKTASQTCCIILGVCC